MTQPALDYGQPHARWAAPSHGGAGEGLGRRDPGGPAVPCPERLRHRDAHPGVLRARARAADQPGLHRARAPAQGHPARLPGGQRLYSRRDEALLFGYFPGRASGATVFTCLSHGIVAHETAHSVLDGLRNRFMEPSSDDQAAAHEGLADLVGILSVCSLPEIVGTLVDMHLTRPERHHGLPRGTLGKEDTAPEALRRSVLLAVGKQFGQETQALEPDAAPGPAIVSFWLEPGRQQTGAWSEHRDINEVMLATSLVPGGYLAIPAGVAHRPNGYVSGTSAGATRST